MQEFDPESIRILKLMVREFLRQQQNPPKKSLPFKDSGGGSGVLTARIWAATAINGLVRWKYTIRLGYMDMSTSPSTGGTWVTTSGDLYAFNSAEDLNYFGAGYGTIGTGIEVDQATGEITGCQLKPLPVNGFVEVKQRGIDSATGTVYYTIINFANSAT